MGTSDGSGAIVEFDLSGDIPENTESGFLFALPATKTYTGLVRAIERAKDDENARGFFVRFGSQSTSFARSEELGALFASLRGHKDRPIVCHTDAIENASAWLLGEACDELWVSPAGSVDTVGIAGQLVFLKGALEKLKVKADFISMGRYKSAAETFTRSEPSEPARQNLAEVLASIRATWLDETAKARKNAAIRESLEDGPWSPEQARQRGLIDAVGNEPDALDDVKKRSREQDFVTAFGPRKKDGAGLDIAELVRTIAGVESSTNKPHIAVVPAEGSISMSSGGLMSEVGITAKAFKKTLRRLKEDDDVKAVVLRIDSPGGSALASDIIWQELMDLRKKKPIVASVGGMAASGGYYLACAANRLIAERTSIVGSIGVLGGKIVLDEALASVGVNTLIVPANPEPEAAARAAYLSPLASWDDATRARVRDQMQSVYELFLSRVSKGRSKPVDVLRSLAEGRIYSGSQALEHQLVDEIGGLERALTVARSLSGLGEGAPIRVEGTGETLLEALLLGDKASEEEIAAGVARFIERRSVLLERVAAPLRPFISSLQPLLDGEATLCAMPFGIVIR